MSKPSVKIRRRGPVVQVWLEGDFSKLGLEKRSATQSGVGCYYLPDIIYPHTGILNLAPTKMKHEKFKFPSVRWAASWCAAMRKELKELKAIFS